MNVTSPEAQAACAPAGAAGAVRESHSAETISDADAAEFFLGLLAQATTVATALPEAPAAALPQVPDETDDDAEPAAVDWVMPFLAPPAVPVPLDIELPPPGDGDDASVVGISAGPTDQPVVPLPALLDDAGTAIAAGPLTTGADQHAADASISAAVAAAPRVEATGNGAVQAVVRHVPVPVSDGRWPEHVGHEVRVLVERGVQAATLRLTPEHLGPVDVRIDIVNDKANIVFGAAHADTRSALTEAIPKLREMFAGAGLTLGDAGVRQDVPGRFAGHGPRGSRNDFGGDATTDEPIAAAHAVRLGLVDAYA